MRGEGAKGGARGGGGRGGGGEEEWWRPEAKDATIKLVDLEGKTRSGKPDDALAELISFSSAASWATLSRPTPTSRP